MGVCVAVVIVLMLLYGGLMLLLYLACRNRDLQREVEKANELSARDTETNRPLS